MATRTPRRSTRSQSRELSVLHSEDDSVSVASTSSRATNERAKQRKPKASTRKVKKEETIIEDEQVPIASIASSENDSNSTKDKEVGLNELEEEEEEVIEEMDQLMASEGHAFYSQSAPKTNKLRQKIALSLERLAHFLPYIPPILMIASLILAALLLSPNKPFARKVYVDENALQPGSASVEWSWNQVDLADQAAERIALVADSPAEVRAALLTRELLAIGLTPHNQSYSFEVPTGGTKTKVISGLNTYARFAAARGDGREAFVIAASWKSAWDGTDDPDAKEDFDRRANLEGAMSAYERRQVRRTNVRGIASAILLARHLSGYGHWSKDLIFVVSDGEMEGMQAWTSSYFGREQSNLKAEKLHCGQSAIWNALAIDYPSDSFSHIVIKHEGLQGQLPNMDVINTFTRIAQRTDGIPVSLAASSEHDPRWKEKPLGALGKLLERHLWKDDDGSKKYLSGLLNVAVQLGYLSSGHPSGIHGLFHRYHVDAITVYLHPAKGPYGFLHIGRAVESMTRSMSNLLERLHHSQFFYLLTSPYRFIEVAKYLPVAALLSAALSIAGVCIWIEEGKRAYSRKSALILLVRAAIEEEEEDGKDALIAVKESTLIASTSDALLKDPTHAQLLSSFISLLVERSLRRGNLLGSTKLRPTAALMQILGRPISSAVAILLSCHAIGGYAYYTITRAPTNCAIDGVERCKPLRLITLITTLSAFLLIWRIRRANSILLHQRLSQCQPQLPEAVIPFLISCQGFRIQAIARAVHSFALLEAGMLVLAISLVNFSLALVVGSIICLPLCAIRLPASTEMAEEDMMSTFTDRKQLERSISPASNDTDNVETLTQSLPNKQRLSLGVRVRLFLQSGIFLALSPSCLIYLMKGAFYISCNLHANACLAPTLLDSTFDKALMHYHILGTLTIPFITIIYLPLVLVAFVANTLAALG